MIKPTNYAPPSPPNFHLVPGARYAFQVSWEEDSQGTAGTMDTAENMRLGLGLGVSFSGLPDSDDGEDDEDLFEVADNLDLGAVDLCVSLGWCPTFGSQPGSASIAVVGSRWLPPAATVYVFVPTCGAIYSKVACGVLPRVLVYFATVAGVGCSRSCDCTLCNRIL